MRRMEESNPKKICIYCDTWGQGGIETFIAETILQMDLSGLALSVVCAEKKGSRFDSKLKEKEIIVSALQKKANLSAFEKTIKCVRPLVKYCRAEHIDVVHLNVFHGVSLVQAFILKGCGIKHIIVHCHGSGLRKSRGQILKLFGHHICKSIFSWAVDERWAASTKAAKFLFGNAPANIIPNGIEVQSFRFDEQKRKALREKLNIENRTLLGCVGRLEAQKNQGYLLAVISELKHRGNDIALLLIGSGEDYESLEQQTKKMGLSDDVIFLGEVDCVNDWMCAMDALLVPSISEGLSIVAIEAQASGLPVFCSLGVPEEVQLTDSVQFIPLSEQKNWIKAIESIPTYDRAKANTKMIGSRYDIKKSAMLVRNLYLNA